MRSFFRFRRARADSRFIANRLSRRSPRVRYLVDSLDAVIIVLPSSDADAADAVADAFADAFADIDSVFAMEVAFVSFHKNHGLEDNKKSQSGEPASR